MPYIREFSSLRLTDTPLVGGKTAAIGELGLLAADGVETPAGFAVTAEAYRDCLERAGALPKLHALFDDLDLRDLAELGRRAERARAIVYEAAADERLCAEIRDAWRGMKTRCGPGLAVAVRSSATAEDLPTASFAGQHDSFLHITGEAALIEACRRCFASIFNDRAIVYRADNGFDHFKVALSVAVMKMVRADLASSGVAFTLDTESGFPDVVFLTGAYGLGEPIVQGRVDPDEFHVHKPTLRQGYRAVLRRKLGEKAIKLALVRRGLNARTIERSVSPRDRRRFCLADEEVLRLAQMAMRIEDHFSRLAGEPRAMDIEWAKDGLDGRLYILQARPETAAARRPADEIQTWRLTGRGEPLVQGRAVGAAIAAGRVRVVGSAKDLADFQKGEVLVATTTSPDWEAVMKQAAAIVTDRGGRTCHAAILARELGIPAVVGTGEATARLSSGQAVTVSCADGESGRVYAGELPFVVEKTKVATLEPTRTQVMLNLAHPDQAFQHSRLPVAGVGLARMEFIIGSAGIHPMALAHPEHVGSAAARRKIAQLAAGFASPGDYFVERVSEGVGTIAAAFYPRPVIVRLSDFKTNEYAALLGGRDFEPAEANPMLGFRGAARYAHPAYADGFGLECRALLRVREVMGLKNLAIMVPFCRTVKEAEKVLQSLAANGLVQGHDGLEIYVMCEIPNNVIQIDAFAALFDGISIGSNDLTQLVLGVDRDSETVAFEFDERDPGVLEFLRQAVVGARCNHRHVGICGEAPANDPEIARFLIEQGVTSISVNPASALSMMRLAASVEREAVGAPT
ncbi:phosphoenolpyruvate synthase [Phenylobacterium montanum]|uniref:Phosphoenolpyruvate synthase n=1 Tax=Phenylobacterium montanum TaxID=2823693 RepID=A0A975ITM6_9CAUL|nr:phosphoenolpyruvate synthase [Caulobacter sp. S6]QUD86895.1 phosphoenolpyruvate synthase [Caulobacter sp. S6]